MGEYARRLKDLKKNGEAGKIYLGCCTNLTNLTMPQLFEVDYCYAVSKFETFWFRPSLDSERGIEPGDFSTLKAYETRFWLEYTDDDIKMFRTHTGIAQVSVPYRHKLFRESYNDGCGIMINVTCAHGFNEFDCIPKGETLARPFYNGRNPNVFFIDAVGIRNKKLVFRIKCSICDSTFFITYDEFLKAEMFNNEANKVCMNDSIYNLQFGENAEWWKDHIDFDSIKKLEVDIKDECPF